MSTATLGSMLAGLVASQPLNAAVNTAAATAPLFINVSGWGPLCYWKTAVWQLSFSGYDTTCNALVNNGARGVRNTLEPWL